MAKCSIILSLLFLAVVTPGCRKHVNPKIPDPDKIPVPLLTLDSSSDTAISALHPASFHAKFTVDVFFKNRELPKQIDLVVVRNGDAANAKTVLPNITSWPVTFEITGQQLIDLFGAPIAIGDAFEFSTDVTIQNGMKILAFPPTGGTPFGPGLYNIPGSSPVLTFAAPCRFNAQAYKADFTVLRDDWFDYKAGDGITINVIDETHMSFKYKADSALQIVMTIDTATNGVSITRQKYGNYGGDDYYVETSPAAESVVDPCKMRMTLTLRHTLTNPANGFFDAVLDVAKK